MRWGLPLVLGLTTFFMGLTFTFGHYQPHLTVLPFEVLQPVLPPNTTPWFGPQHVWGLLFLVGGAGILLPLHLWQRAVSLILGAAVWGAFSTAIVAKATWLDPHHHTGGGTGVAFLGIVMVFIIAIQHLQQGYRDDREVFVRRWRACFGGETVELPADRLPGSLAVDPHHPYRKHPSDISAEQKDPGE